MEDIKVYTFLAQTCYWGHTQEKFSQGTEASCRAKLERRESCQLRKGTRGNWLASQPSPVSWVINKRTSATGVRSRFSAARRHLLQSAGKIPIEHWFQPNVSGEGSASTQLLLADKEAPSHLPWVPTMDPTLQLSLWLQTFLAWLIILNVPFLQMQNSSNNNNFIYWYIRRRGWQTLKKNWLSHIAGGAICCKVLLLSITCLTLSRALKRNKNQQTITKPVYPVYLQPRAAEITVPFSELIHGSLDPYNHL